MTDATAERRPGEERRAHDLYDDDLVEDARVVRPYALTRGRTRSLSCARASSRR